jgi:hypothetical protein
VFLAEVLDVDAGGFEDPQPQQAEQAHQREVEPIRCGLPRRGQHGLELQVAEPERRRIRWHVRAAHILSR